MQIKTLRSVRVWLARLLFTMKWNILISLVQLWGRNSEGIVTVSPSVLTPVCQGAQVEITCTTTQSFLRWNITLSKELILAQTGTFTRTLSSFGSSSEVSPLTVNSSAFTFTRTSGEGRVPLMSTLVINPANRILNGTIVTCMQVSTPDSSATVIHILSENDYYPNEVNISFLSEKFGREDVTVTLEWTRDSALISFNISVVPQVAIQLNGSLIAQLVVPYNTVHNVSVSATVLCGLSSTTYVILNYANCGSPQTPNDAVIFEFTNDLPLEGTNVTFSCPPELILIGPSLSTCMGTVKWEPDPKEVMCKVLLNCGPPTSPPNGFTSPYTSTVVGARVTFACHNSCQNGIQTSSNDELHSAVCNSLGQWEPDPHIFCSRNSAGTKELKCTRNNVTLTVVSSVTIFLVTSIVILSIGFAFGHYIGQKGRSGIQEQMSSRTIDHQRIARDEFQEHTTLELTDNVAYMHNNSTRSRI